MEVAAKAVQEDGAGRVALPVRVKIGACDTDRENRLHVAFPGD